ncbi:hypothetical protein A2U01_0101036, partial [Trifolium medium]|nr:hypothetical protein [Trifolium medium]
FPQTAPLILPDQNCDRDRRCSDNAPVEAEGVVYLQALRRSSQYKSGVMVF